MKRDRLYYNKHFRANGQAGFRRKGIYLRRVVLLFLLLAAFGGCLVVAGKMQPQPQTAGRVAAKVYPVISSAAKLHANPQVKDAMPDTEYGPVQPLRNDGIPARMRADFMVLRKMFNLTLVPTYEGSNQETHPKLLYFPKGWNGYRYWMSMTPYPATNDDYENPSIVTSNDLKTWVVPRGLKNPITGVPKDVSYGGHFSDSQIVMNGRTMELWYRANIGNRRTLQPDYRVDYYYRITSTDGIHWSAPSMMQAHRNSILSLAVLYDPGKYRFWYTNGFHRLMYAESEMGYRWTNTQRCNIPLPTGYVPWHQDVVYNGGTYYLLQTGYMAKPYSFALFLSESRDGIHFTKGVPFYPSDNPTILHKTWLYRSTMAMVEKGIFQMVVSYRLPGNKWFMTQCALSQKVWDHACLNGERVILKSPVSEPEAVVQDRTGEENVVSKAFTPQKPTVRREKTGTELPTSHAAPKPGTGKKTDRHATSQGSKPSSGTTAQSKPQNSSAGKPQSRAASSGITT